MNDASNTGGDIYAQYSDNNLIVDSISITNYDSSNSIYLE